MARPRIRFGPAGKPVGFKGPMERVPEYLESMGLDALEYEAVRGVRISEDKARVLGEEARAHDIVLSLHAPYFINLSSPDRSVVERSTARLRDALIAAEWMGAYAVVFHPGYIKGNKTREEALRRVIEALRALEEELAGKLSIAEFSPETTGKVSQVGDLEEVVEICRSLQRCRPTVDWAHLYARREGGYLTSEDDVLKAIEYLEKELGSRALRPLHTHFSKIEYGRGGEREHHTLSEAEYGPDWRLVCKAYVEAGVEAVVISESPILDRDALVMKRICKEVGAKVK
ncbi:MAG: deoxyribonuclease IV [Desulfurococcales archaeon]|nr:deoxyribonuclease IV [Desulfurococcales archaeon]